MLTFSLNPKNVLKTSFALENTHKPAYLAQRVDGSYIKLNIDQTDDEEDVSISDPMPEWDYKDEPSFKELRSFSIIKTPTNADTYGKCIDCGKTITYKRSSRLVIVKRCTRCQSIHELTYETGHLAFI